MSAIKTADIEAEYVRSIFNLMRKKPQHPQRAALLTRLEGRYAYLPIGPEFNALVFQLKCIEGAYEKSRLQVTDLHPEIDTESKRLSILMAMEACLEGVMPDENVHFFDPYRGRLTFREKVYDVEILSSGMPVAGLYKAIPEEVHFLVLDQQHFEGKWYDIVLITAAMAQSIVEKPNYRWALKVFWDVLKGKE